MTITNEDIEKTKLILEEWKTVIETQMHFNDMLMRLRTTAVSIVLAFFGAAAISLQYPQLFLKLFNFSFHAAVLIIISGLVLLISIYVLDYYYYYKMLLGAVERGYQIDQLYKEKAQLAELKMFGMSTEISKAIGEKQKSKLYVWAFYLGVLIFGILFILAILFCFTPPNNTVWS